MASATAKTSHNTANENKRPLRIIDPTCGMLLAPYKVHGAGHEYYGIHIDLMCVKMTALNLFLNGIWNSEVMCADALRPDDFVIAYHISLLPLGIFKIGQKEQSRLWNMHCNSFSKEQKETDIPFKTIATQTNQNDATQLDLF